MNTLTKLPTSNATWRKIVSLATYAGVEPFLDRQWSSRYGGTSGMLLDERLIKFAEKRLQEDQFNLKKIENPSQKENTPPIAKPEEKTEAVSLENKPLVSNDEKKTDAISASNSSGSDMKEQSSKPEEIDKKSVSDSLSDDKTASIELDKDLPKIEDDLESAVAVREKPVDDAPIGSSFKHFTLKSNALSEARNLFHRVKPSVTLQPNPAVKAFPQVFKIPFLQKRDLLVLSASSREQAEYLFNKALKFNPSEVFNPLSVKKAKKADGKTA